jgi:hypothetical protein
MEELQRYILDAENGLFKTVTHERITVSLFYHPVEVLLYQELVANKGLATLNEIKPKYSNYAYFILRLSENSEEFLNKFARKEELYPLALDYFVDGIKNDLSLIADTFKIIPENVMLMQSFGIADHTDILVGFITDGLHKRENFKIILADSEFISGFYEFHFKAKEIRCVPILNPLSYEVI